MAYDGFYAGLSTRGSVNEILNQAQEIKNEIDAQVVVVSGLVDEAAIQVGLAENFAQDSANSATASQGFADDSAASALDAANSAANVTSNLLTILAQNDGATKVGSVSPTSGSNVTVQQSLNDVNARITREAEGTPTGAWEEHWSSNYELRYDILDINGSTTNRGAQSFTFDEKNRNLFLMEGGIITRYPMDGPIGVNSIDSTGSLGSALGHQGLSTEYKGDQVYLWSTSVNGGRFACRFQYTAGVPVNTADHYELFPSGTYANSTSCTPTISSCGTYLIAHGTIFGQVSNTRVRVFKVADLLANGPGDVTSLVYHEFATQGPWGTLVDADNPLQGTACDGVNVYLMAGGTGFASNVNKRLFTFTISGRNVSADLNCTIGKAQAQADPDFTRYEPEGMALMRQPGGGLSLHVSILSGNPGQRRFRIYGCGLSKHFVGNTYTILGNYRGSLGGNKSSGRDYIAMRASEGLAGSGTNWYGPNDATQPGGIGDFTGNATRRVTTQHGETTFVSDATYTPLIANKPDSGVTIQMRRGSLITGYINQSTANVGLFAMPGLSVQLASAQSTDAAPIVRWQASVGGEFIPFLDATYNLGSTTRRVNNSYFAVAPTVTSDRRNKREIQAISDDILDAWESIGFSKYKLDYAVDSKGEDARWHMGVIAQEIIEAFSSRGIDPFQFGLICWDQWEGQEAVVDDNGVEVEPEIKAGDRYSVRYEEALCLEAALMRRELNRIKALLK